MGCMFQMRQLTLVLNLAWCGPPLIEALLCFFTNYTNVLFISICLYKFTNSGPSLRRDHIEHFECHP